MPNITDLNPSPVRALIIGYPGSGKTGCIASLLDAGYKVRLVDFESNYAVLKAFTDPVALKNNLDVLTFQDDFQMDTSGRIVPVGVPHAFESAMRSLKRWKYKNPDGTETDLGCSHDWGPDTVVVVDSVTANGEAVLRRVAAMMNRKLQQSDYGIAVDDQLAFFKTLCRYDALRPDYNAYHVVVLAHLQMIGPKEIDRKEPETINKDIQRDVAELLPTRLYPIAATKNFSQKFSKEFSTVIVAEIRTKLGRTGRYLTTNLREEVDTKIPARNVKPDYPVETGLAEIFTALGHTAPGLKAT